MAVAAALVPVIAGLVEGGINSSKASSQQAKSDALFAQRRAYKTPSQVIDIFNQAQNNAQTGFDPTTMDYLTSQTQGSLAGTLNTAKQLGADPNNFAAILNQNFQDIFKIGSENNLLKMKKFDALMSATQLVAQNKDAEFASQDNLLKDQLQTSAQRTQVDRANEQGGFNLAMNGVAGLVNYYGNQNKQPQTGSTPDYSYHSPATVDSVVAPTSTVVAPPLIYKNPLTGN